MKRETSAGAIIFRKNKGRKYLLLHYESGHWDYVKGNVEKKEKAQQTIKREAKEEAGITDLSFISGFKKKINYFYKKEKELIAKSVIFLLAETGQKQIKLSHEHIGYRWLGFKEALKQLTYNNAKDILKKAEEFLKHSKQKTLKSFTSAEISQRSH